MTWPSPSTPCWIRRSRRPIAPTSTPWSGSPSSRTRTIPKKPEELAQKPIEVVDDHTIRFRLRYPSGAFLAVLVNPRAGIVPEHLLKGADLNTAEFNRKPIGTGPFKFVEWRRGERIVMEANDRLPRRPAGARPAHLPHHPRRRRAAPGAAGRRRRLHREPAADRDGAPQADGRPQGARRRQHVLHLLRLAPGRGALHDIRVRRALYHAIDVPSIVREVLQGYAASRHRAVPAVRAGRSTPSVKPYAYDPARAKALLAEAGWKPGPDGILVQGRQALQLLDPPRPGRPDREGHAGHHPGVPEEASASRSRWSRSTGRPS